MSTWGGERAAAGPHPAAPAAASKRVLGIDLARGTAMVFVCLSHFADVFFAGHTGETEANTLRAVGMVASPMFVILSGMTLGYIYRTNPIGFGATRQKLLDRALFMVTIGHIVIVLVTMRRMGSTHQPWSVIYITDIIAICVVAGCALIDRLGARQRAQLGLACYAASWVAVFFWHPALQPVRRMKHFLVGPFQTNSWIYAVPLLPWLGVYLAGTALGEHFGVAVQNRRQLAFARLVVRAGAAAVFAGIGIKVLFLLLNAEHELPNGIAFRMVYLLSTPMEKLPPSPDYLFCFGGVALVLSGLLLRFGPRLPVRAAAPLGAIGRSSLFVFMLQFFVYYTVVFSLRPHERRLWPVTLILTIAAVALPAVAWDAANLNRYLSLRALGRALRQRVRTVQSAPAS